MIKLLNEVSPDNIKEYLDLLDYRTLGLGNIDVSIIENCNLNCKGCDHFSPLVKEHQEVDIDSYTQLLQRLKLVVGTKKFYGISIMGGEPLMHSRLKEICEITRNIFPKQTIKIVSNGILLTDEILTCCRNLNIEILISKYDCKKQFYHLGLDRTGNKKYKCCNNYTCDINKIKMVDKSQYEFYNVFNCSQLNINGDYFPCIIPANINKYNEYFNETLLPIKGKDFVNIFEIDSLDKIIELNNQKHGLNFCKYCGGVHHLFDWKTSKCDINEW